jgi:hypothetical protein
MENSLNISNFIVTKIQGEHVEGVEGHLPHDTTTLIGVNRKSLCSSIISTNSTSIGNILWIHKGIWFLQCKNGIRL